MRISGFEPLKSHSLPRSGGVSFCVNGVTGKRFSRAHAGETKRLGEPSIPPSGPMVVWADGKEA
jgi:hypothetical protein